MSTKSDKTKEKLLSSMRRTKAGASESTESPASSTPEISASTEKSPAPKAKPAARKAPAKAASSDAYQSGRRIWPD